MSTVSWITPRGDLGTVAENYFYSFQFEAEDPPIQLQDAREEGVRRWPRVRARNSRHHLS